ncbi:MAG: hypothetical protein V8T87_09650 [Victivallales bacterium]
MPPGGKRTAPSAEEKTITCSGGDSLKIETTSLAVLAWLRIDGRFAPNVESAMKWLFERCKNGRFGSTQSTILALKAINAYDKARAVPKNAGSVRLVVDGSLRQSRFFYERIERHDRTA